MHITKIKAERPYIFDVGAHILMRVEINGEPTIAELERAIVKAVQVYPTLNSRILMDTDGECYYIPNEAKRVPEIEVCDNFVDSEELLNEQCKREFDIQNGELVRFLIVQNEETTEMNVIQHHLGGDGKSMLILIETIMNNLANRCDGRREEKLKVFDEKFLSQHVKMNELVEMTVKSFNQKWNEEGYSFDLSDRADNFNKFWSKHDVTYRKIEFSKEELHDLLKVCKSRGVTLNNLITTLMFEAKINRDFKLGLIVDARSKDDKTMGNYVGAIRLENITNPEQGLWENTKYIDEFIKSQLVDRRKLLLGCLVKCKVESSLMDAASFEDVDSKVADEYNNAFMFGTSKDVVCLSNLGVASIEQQYGDYGIEKIEFVSPLTYGFKCNISAITINNNFIISMSCLDNNADYLQMIGYIEDELRNLIHTYQSEMEKDMEKELIYA